MSEPRSAAEIVIEGYVSITPLHLDLTDHRAVDALADFGRSLDAQYRPTARKRARSE